MPDFDIYIGKTTARDNIPEDMPIDTARLKWDVARWFFFVVDKDNCYKGVVSHKDLQNCLIVEDDGSPKIVRTICNENAKHIVAERLDDPSVRHESNDIFRKMPKIFYLPVIDRSGAPLGIAYRKINSLESTFDAWSKNHHWELYEHGETWSDPWGSSEAQWHASIRPRVARYLPAGTLLEIAPGHGRWSRFLINEANAYLGVDYSSECAEYCKQRFSDKQNAKFFNNDGQTLSMAADESCDFVFSFDSLVHVEMDVLDSYIKECLRVLKPGCAAFIHHSNMGMYSDPRNPDWFAYDVSGASVGDSVERYGGGLVVQEGVHWSFGADRCNACFTTFVKPAMGAKAQSRRFFINDSFMEEAHMIKSRIHRLYYC